VTRDEIESKGPGQLVPENELPVRGLRPLDLRKAVLALCRRYTICGERFVGLDDVQRALLKLAVEERNP
jgi:hypothetical protein